MPFLSFAFVGFMILLLFIYFIIPKKYQWCLLLVGSYIFYAYATPYFLVFLVISTVITYFCGVKLGQCTDALKNALNHEDQPLSKEERKALKHQTEHKKKLILAGCLFLNILILAVLKYFNFCSDNMTALIQLFGGYYEFPKVNWLLPLGISFYTFITVGYCIDVYRELCEPQKNIFKYALFVSYFPQISQGPINRYHELSTQLYEEHAFEISRFKSGGYRIVIGLFKKVVVADRLAVYVDRVYGLPQTYSALTLLAATVFYAIQIYCDFSGYMDISIGISDMLGIKMSENFDKPYFSRSIPEYWRRWHITLGAWFRDYLYYPVIRSKWCKNLSKKIEQHCSKKAGRAIGTVSGLLIVWFTTGLWHGASWHYVMHGLYHGTLIILSFLLAGTFQSIREKLHIKNESKVFHVFQMIRTFILVDISYILFRSGSMKDAWYIMKTIVGSMRISVEEIKQSLLPFTEDNTAVAFSLVVVAAILGVFICELADYNQKDLFRKHKYVNAVLMLVIILLFGMFGQSSFIYMQY
ncbi:MAG: MBOAT family protein [Clostridia bacterium]|nr:MBOAT family protein [Clostridia bacterium]